jgi:hypothetical protein
VIVSVMKSLRAQISPIHLTDAFAIVVRTAWVIVPARLTAWSDVDRDEILQVRVVIWQRVKDSFVPESDLDPCIMYILSLWRESENTIIKPNHSGISMKRVVVLFVGVVLILLLITFGLTLRATPEPQANDSHFVVFTDPDPNWYDCLEQACRSQLHWQWDCEGTTNIQTVLTKCRDFSTGACVPGGSVDNASSNSRNCAEEICSDGTNTYPSVCVKTSARCVC